MINNKSVLCLVLARKNSKGLPGKNLKKINGIPLVGISVKTALNLNILMTVFVKY